MRLDIEQFYPPEEVLEYFEGKSSLEEAWNGCRRGDWMIWLAFSLGVDDRTLTGAKALCAGTVRKLMVDGRSRDAIKAALKYAAGKIDGRTLDRYTRLCRQSRL
jgi:hypothetical protein